MCHPQKPPARTEFQRTGVFGEFHPVEYHPPTIIHHQYVIVDIDQYQQISRTAESHASNIGTGLERKGADDIVGQIDRLDAVSDGGEEGCSIGCEEDVRSSS